MASGKDLIGFFGSTDKSTENDCPALTWIGPRSCNWASPATAAGGGAPTPEAKGGRKPSEGDEAVVETAGDATTPGVNDVGAACTAGTACALGGSAARLCDPDSVPDSNSSIEASGR